MESNNEGDNESLVENNAKAYSLEGLHIFRTNLFYLVGLQGLLRLVSFIFKWKMLSYLTVEEFGLHTVQFHTFTMWIFYISREGFRCGCLRQNNFNAKQDIDSKLVHNNSRVLAVAWLTVPLGIIVTISTLSFVMWWQGLYILSEYNSSICILGAAAILELCCEPLYILAQHLLWLRLRVLIEGLATFSRCVVTYILVLRGIGLEGGLAFVYGQLAYSCCLLLCYWCYFLSTYPGPIFPFRLVYYKGSVFCFGFKRNLEFDVSLIQLCLALTMKTGLLKYFQEESERLVLVHYETTYNQGIYGLVDNIGSLVVRSIFQPFEESAFTMFSKGSFISSTIDKKKSNNCNIERMFLLALKLASFIGLVFVALGPNFAYVLLRLYSKDWSDGNATITLGYYCIYILTLAINGVSEAFLRVQQELSNWQFILKLVVFPIASMFLSRILLFDASSVGLILAKSIIMGIQICYSLHFIQEYFKHSQTFSLWQALPNWRLLGVLMTSALITYLSKSFVLDSENFFPTATLHIGVGIACLSGLFVAMFKYERTFLQEIVAFQNKKRY